MSMQQINPYSITGNTNHVTAFSQAELDKTIAFTNNGPSRFGVVNLWAEFTFKYFVEQAEFDAMPQLTKNLVQEQYRSIPYIYNFYVNCSAGFGVGTQCPWQQITISYINASGTSKEIKKLIMYAVPALVNTNFFTPQPFIIDDYVKSITVKLESKALTPYIAMLALKTEGVYDSGIRFLKNGETYSLARYAKNSGGGLKFKDSSGITRDLLLVNTSDPKASLIRVRMPGMIFSIAKL